MTRSGFPTEPAALPTGYDLFPEQPTGDFFGSGQDEVVDLRTELAARPRANDGRRAGGSPSWRLSPGRALAGAAVSVGGVLLGIGSLLWVTGDPSQGPGPTVQRPVAQAPLVQDVPSETEVAPSDPPAAAALPVPAPLVPAEAPADPLVLPVTVLNNSNRTGLAAQAAARFEQGGWPVALTGNFRGQIPVTTVYYDPGLEASARAFAARFEGIIRVRPRFPTLPARGVVVVLTREFSV